MSEELDYEDVAYGEGLEAGVKAERKRFIKLIKSHSPFGFDDDSVECRCGKYPYDKHLIKLIEKGKDK